MSTYSQINRPFAVVFDLEFTAWDGSMATRWLRPGDVAILFRALTNVEYYEEALRRYGIDYYLVGNIFYAFKSTLKRFFFIADYHR